MLLLVFLKIGYATECTFSTFTPVAQGFIVIHAEDLRRDIHRFQTGLQHRCFSVNIAKFSRTKIQLRVKSRGVPADWWVQWCGI